MSERKPLFERLKKGLEEGVAHAKGELTLKTVQVPEAPPEIDAKTLAAMRTQAGMSQAVFAKLLNVSIKTLQSWEQGLRSPSYASKRLIHVFCENPEMFCRTVGLPPVKLKGVAVQKKNGGKSVIVLTTDQLFMNPK